jgi:hypothetical protein
LFLVFQLGNTFFHRPWEQISRPKVEAVVFRPQTKIYQAPRFNDMDKMRALQSRLIQNIYTRPLAVRQITQENLKEKNSGIGMVITRK